MRSSSKKSREEYPTSFSFQKLLSLTNPLSGQIVGIFGDKRAAALATGLSIYKLKQLRLDDQLKQGIHWVRLGNRSIRYNLPLCIDWVANQGSPELHERAIQKFFESLPSS